MERHDPDPLLKQGYLWKRAPKGLFRLWRKRFFVLRRDFAAYYAPKEKHGVPYTDPMAQKGVIFMKDVTSVRLGAQNSRRFGLVVEIPERTYELEAADKTIATEWVEEFRSAAFQAAGGAHNVRVPTSQWQEGKSMRKGKDKSSESEASDPESPQEAVSEQREAAEAAPMEDKKDTVEGSDQAAVPDAVVEPSSTRSPDFPTLSFSTGEKIPKTESERVIEQKIVTMKFFDLMEKAGTQHLQEEKVVRMEENEGEKEAKVGEEQGKKEEDIGAKEDNEARRKEEERAKDGIEEEGKEEGRENVEEKQAMAEEQVEKTDEEGTSEQALEEKQEATDPTIPSPSHPPSSVPSSNRKDTNDPSDHDMEDDEWAPDEQWLEQKEEESGRSSSPPLSSSPPIPPPPAPVISPSSPPVSLTAVPPPIPPHAPYPAITVSDPENDKADPLKRAKRRKSDYLWQALKEDIAAKSDQAASRQDVVYFSFVSGRDPEPLRMPESVKRLKKRLWQKGQAWLKRAREGYDGGESRPVSTAAKPSPPPHTQLSVDVLPRTRVRSLSAGTIAPPSPRPQQDTSPPLPPIPSPLPRPLDTNGTRVQDIRAMVRASSQRRHSQRSSLRPVTLETALSTNSHAPLLESALLDLDSDDSVFTTPHPAAVHLGRQRHNPGVLHLAEPDLSRANMIAD